MCESFVGELGESAIYKVFRNAPTMKRPLEEYLCNGRAETIRGSCTPRSRKSRDDL